MMKRLLQETHESVVDAVHWLWILQTLIEGYDGSESQPDLARAVIQLNDAMERSQALLGGSESVFANLYEDLVWDAVREVSATCEHALARKLVWYHVCVLAEWAGDEKPEIFDSLSIDPKLLCEAICSKSQREWDTTGRVIVTLLDDGEELVVPSIDHEEWENHLRKELFDALAAIPRGEQAESTQPGDVADDPHGFKRERTEKGVTVEDQVERTWAAGRADMIGWSASDWARHLACGVTSIKESRVWREEIIPAREANKNIRKRRRFDLS